MSDESGSGGESIGRPEEWREGRYEKDGKTPKDPVKDSVLTPPGAAPVANDPPSTPVTRKDYEQSEPSRR